jgi:hypothetical protein
VQQRAYRRCYLNRRKNTLFNDTVNDLLIVGDHWLLCFLQNCSSEPLNPDRPNSEYRWYFKWRYLAVARSLKSAQPKFFSGRNERYRGPLAPRTPRSTDTVNVRFDITRNIKINNVRYDTEIKSTGRNIGCHEKPPLADLKVLDNPLPLGLSHISIECDCIVAALH